ncbi:MAG: OmpA family protein [Alphaproteobacteria bacterium]|nr:OmpA family protein [Alphaproteobacteria bacterium]MBR2342166.1 OmpA family protein [Alphaproteobacteria bacterium]MBR2482755.1 OmpA family protein [Alphaproteobacteria bacterium]
MKNTKAIWGVSRVLMMLGVVSLGACARSNGGDMEYMPVATPTVDYVESLDVYAAPHKDSFLNQLAMNYRSYAIYNARTSGYAEMGELFANKAVAAFSGELPFPESLDNWPVENEQEAFELYTAYNELMEQLKNDASTANPELAAEAQAKFDCWLSAAASGQMGTAAECRDRYFKTMTALRDCTGGKIVKKVVEQSGPMATPISTTTEEVTMVAVERENANNGYYPDTRNMVAMNGANRTREGVIIVNNVNVPEHLIKPEPVQPMIFNQNIYGGNKSVSTNVEDCEPAGSVHCTSRPVAVVLPDGAAQQQPAQPQINEELVTREEFINMMMAMREELAAINARLDQIQAAQGEKTMIKVQQIPLEPKQHVMEEVFEIRFDFNKATIKPEYQDLIRQLASATQENKNIKVSVVGHTDTSGTKNYNYALGGRRAEAVQKMLIQYGIPASQIVAVSAGEEDLAVPTPDNTPNADNRRVRVVKEVHYEELEPAGGVALEVEEVPASECGEYGCMQ